jgi:hypothetical protein
VGRAGGRGSERQPVKDCLLSGGATRKELDCFVASAPRNDGAKFPPASQRHCERSEAIQEPRRNYFFGYRHGIPHPSAPAGRPSHAADFSSNRCVERDSARSPDERDRSRASAPGCAISGATVAPLRRQRGNAISLIEPQVSAFISPQSRFHHVPEPKGYRETPSRTKPEVLFAACLAV